MGGPIRYTEEFKLGAVGRSPIGLLKGLSGINIWVDSPTAFSEFSKFYWL